MLEAAKNVSKVAPSKSPVKELSCVLLESNSDTGEIFLTATNHEVSIQQKARASVEESGAILVNPRLLEDMMSKLEGEFVAFSADRPELLEVTGGSCIFQINCLPSKSYPKPIMPFPEESVILTGICSLDKRTTFVVSKDKNKLALQCVQVKLKNNTVHAAASDGTKMMLTKDSIGPTNEQEFLLPGRSLQLLSSISSDEDVFEVSDIGKEVVFVRGDMIFTIRKMSTGSFIDAADVIQKVKPVYTALTDAGKMKEALNLVSVSALSGTTKIPINLVLSGNEIILRCNSDNSEASSGIPAKISENTLDKGFFYDVSALIKLFQVVGGRVKLEIDAKGNMLIKTRTEVYFQIPMNPKAKKKKPVKPVEETKEPKSAKGAKDVKKKAA